MKVFKMFWMISFLVFSLFGNSASAEGTRNVAAYNQPAITPVGLYGYDPVSYFAEGGSQPTKGSQEIVLDYKGITYIFSTLENKETFKTDPAKYEPTYGHFCAWAMAQGHPININPQFYTIDGNKIHFFVNTRAKRNFDRDIAKWTIAADKNWKALSGEEPRN